MNPRLRRDDDLLQTRLLSVFRDFFVESAKTETDRL